MFALLILGAVAAYVLDPVQARQVLSMRPSFRIPEFTLGRMSWSDFVAGGLVLAIPQLPLTIGDAVGGIPCATAPAKWPATSASERAPVVRS